MQYCKIKVFLFHVTRILVELKITFRNLLGTFFYCHVDKKYSKEKTSETTKLKIKNKKITIVIDWTLEILYLY